MITREEIRTAFATLETNEQKQSFAENTWNKRTRNARVV